MVTAVELAKQVDAAFAEREPSLVVWPAPWPAQSPPDEAYSVCADPLKYRLLSARTDAWAAVLSGHGVVRLEREVSPAWRALRYPMATVGRTDRWVPTAAGAVPLVVGRLTANGHEDVGVVLGVGDEPAVIESVPDCGCDGCDSGSANDLAAIDAIVMSVITGVLRHAEAPNRSQTTLIDSQRSSSGMGRFRGWDLEVEGSAWLDVTHTDDWLDAL